MQCAVIRLRGGRPSSDVWDHITRERTGDGKIVQRCKYCGLTRKSVQSLASQWALHLVERCDSVDPEVSVEIYETKKDSIKGVKEAGERRGLHLRDPTLVVPAVPNTRNKTARNAIMKAEELGSVVVKSPRRSVAGSAASANMMESGDDDNNNSNDVFVANRPAGIWEHVTKEHPAENGTIVQTCNYCGNTKKAAQLLASSWAVHLVETCREVDPAISHQVWQLKKDSVRAVRDAGSRRGFAEGMPPEPLQLEPYHKTPNNSSKKPAAASRPPSSVDGNSKVKPSTTASNKKQRVMYSAGGDLCDQARADKISLAIMEFVAGCSVSMMVVQSSFFVDLLNSMNETYVKKYLPKADVFTQTWLPKLNEAVDQRLNDHWRAEKDSYVSLGSDVFKDEEGNKSIVVTEAKLDKVAFRDWIVQDEERQKAPAVAQMWIERMVATVGGDPSNIEANFGAVCADFSKINPAAGRAIEDKYPKVFFNGCRSRCGDLLCKDIAAIPQIEGLIKNVKTVVNFVRSHDNVRAAYASRMKQFNGSKLLPLPGGRLAHVDEMIESLLGPEEQNIEVLNALVTDSEWETLVSGISPWSIAEFVALVHNAEFFNKVKCVRGITQPLSIFIRHLDNPSTRASWLLPAFEALEKDLVVWCDDTTTGEYFMEETVRAIKSAFEKRWKGVEGAQDSLDGDAMGLYAPQHLFSMLLDPTTTMSVEELNQKHPLWYPECRKVLKRFYDEDDLIVAKTQLYELVNQTGSWGDEVAESKSYVNVGVAQNRFHIQTVVTEQLKAVDLKPHLLWKVSIGLQFPKLKEVAIRLLTMATQCADVERVCQVPKFVNSRVSSRLKHPKVKQLIYCYVNLRLLRSVGLVSDEDTIMEDFLCDAILEEEVEEKQEEGDGQGEIDSPSGLLL